MRLNLGKLLTYGAVALLCVVFIGLILVRVVLPFLGEGASWLFGYVSLKDLVWYSLAGLSVAGAAGVALSRNILYSAIGLLAALLGVGALYVFLSADFLAVTQLLVYVGGVLVLILFAVMLTSHIKDIKISNSGVGVLGGAALFAVTALLLIFVAVKTPFATVAVEPPLLETSPDPSAAG
jgi:NADH-quinone oxidoreductase subunit J